MDDCVQSIFLNLFENALDKYNPSRSDLLRYINGVTYQQMLNIIAKYKRAKMQYRPSVGGGKPFVSSFGQTPPDVGAEVLLLLDSIKQIKDPTASAVMNLRVDGLSVKDISNQLGIRCTSVKKILSIFKILPE